MMEYSDSEFEKKLMLLKNTRDAIKSLSAWCIKRHGHYKSIISVWLNSIKKVKIEKRLTLFYLANDIIQSSKKKKYKFINGWATTIQKTIPYVRDERIQSKIARIIKIWDKLGVYDDSFLADLTSLLTTSNQKLKLADPVQEFQMDALAVKIRSCVKLEQITDLKMNNLKEANLPLTNTEALQKMLKRDQSLSHKFLNELNDDMSKIESFIKCLKVETIHRAQLIDALEVAKSYYVEQHNEVKIVAQAYFYYTKRVKLLKSELQSLVGSMQTDSTMPLSDINAPHLSTSSISIEKLNIHNINYETVLNPAKYINNIKPYITPDMYTTVQEFHDLTSVSFPAIENHDQQSLTSQFPYDALSRSPDKTFASSSFSKQTNNIHDKSSTYSKSSYEVYVSSPLSSSQQLISGDIVPTTTSSTLMNKNTQLEFHIPQRACDVTVNSDWSTNDTPASPPFHDKIPYQNTSIISKTNEALGINNRILAPKLIDRDDRVLQKNITTISDIDQRNLISLTHFPPKNSSMVFVDVDYRAFSDISIPPLSPNFLIEAINKSSRDNVESVDMNLSHDAKPKLNHDQKHPVVLPLPLPPPIPFDYDQQCVPDVANQWEQPSQLWSTEQSDQWRHPYQWEQEKNDSNCVHNQPQLQWHQHFRSQEDFRPKSKRRICDWPSPSNYIPHSRSTRSWNQDPRFGSNNLP